MSTFHSGSDYPAPVAGIPPKWVDELTVEECWQLLRATDVGRLAVDVAGQPDIFPINYVVSGTTIVFRTAPGTKLAGAVLGRYIAFEIDGVSPDDRSVWSVVVKGTAHEMANMFERYAAEDLPLYPWTASPKPDFVRIDAGLVTGRRFYVVKEADLEGYCAQVTGRRVTTDPLAVAADQRLEHHPDAPRLHPD